VASGLSLPIIGKLLGHAKAVTTERYAHLASDPIRAANNTIASRIVDALQSSGRQRGLISGVEGKWAGPAIATRLPSGTYEVGVSPRLFAARRQLIRERLAVAASVL
jgi:hypothetical protein